MRRQMILHIFTVWFPVPSSEVFAAEYEFSLSVLEPHSFCLPGQSSPRGTSSGEHGWASPARPPLGCGLDNTQRGSCSWLSQQMCGAALWGCPSLAAGCSGGNRAPRADCAWCCGVRPELQRALGERTQGGAHPGRENGA